MLDMEALRLKFLNPFTLKDITSRTKELLTNSHIIVDLFTQQEVQWQIMPTLVWIHHLSPEEV